MYDTRVLVGGVTLTRKGMRSGCRSCYHLCINEGSDPVFLPWYFVWVSGETLTLPSGGKPRLSLFMVCVTYAGPSLGVFDTSKAMEPPAQWGHWPQFCQVCRRQ